MLPPLPVTTPVAINSQMLSDITNKKKLIDVLKQNSLDLSDLDYSYRWGPDDTISLVAIISHPTRAPRIVGASEERRTTIYQYQDGEQIEVEDIPDCEGVTGRKTAKADTTTDPYTWRDLKTYIVEEGGRLVQKTMQDMGLIGDPGVQCPGWYDPEMCPEGKHLSDQDLSAFFKWIPSVDVYQGGDKFRKNCAKIEKMLVFGEGYIASCDADLVEKLIVKYDGTYTGKKRKAGPHRKKLEQWFSDRINPPPKQNFSIFIEEDDLQATRGNVLSVAETAL
jgi:hypothetical protein